MRLAAALRHPNVLALFDWSPPGSQICYLVMELVSGGSLIAGQHPFDRRQVGPLVQQVLTQEPRLDGDIAGRPVIEVIHRCLRSSPGRRLGDGGAVARALVEALAASGIADPEGELQLWARDPSYAARLQARLVRRPVRPSRSMPRDRDAALPPQPALPEAHAPVRRRPLPRWLLIVGSALLGALVVGAVLFLLRGSLLAG